MSEEPSIVCINAVGLIRKYPAISKILEEIINVKGEYYNKHPFKEKEKKFYVQQIKEDLVFLNQDYKEPKIKSKEEIDLDKEYKEQERIKSFLKEDRRKFQSIGCGFHNGVYYFGTKLFRDGKPYTSIITSDKKIYINSSVFINKNWEGNNEIRNDFGLTYKDDFYDEGIEHILSRKVVDKWLYGGNKNITIKSVYDKLISLFKKYIYFEDERKYSLLACYRIASFFMPVWRSRARLFLYADMGSSKSRLTQMLHNTGFNSVSLGDWTLPYLQRLIESTRGETHIDDFETLNEDLKNSSIRLVKVGFMKGFKAGKISEGTKRKPETFDLFNTTTINNTEGLDFITRDRCIILRIPKIEMKEYDKEPNFQDKIWKELRDELYILGLKYPKEVNEIYDEINSEKIRGRLLFIFKPELTIAKMISKEVYNDLEEFWVEEIEQRDTIDFETDWEFLGFKHIYKTLSPFPPLQPLSTLSPPKEFIIEDLVKEIGKELYNEEEFKKHKRGIGIVIGKSLKRSPIFKHRISRGKRIYQVNPKQFKDFLKAKNLLSPLLDIFKGKMV
tara:strand:- start:8821 stop:10497 length:1677 start_codon:yes stop_codon:yes gene_type:complete